MADQHSSNFDSPEPAFKVQPPTAPRSMRRQITPPPLKRSDSYRPSEHQERRKTPDLYRPTPLRYNPPDHGESRAAPSDCYRPVTQYKNPYSRDDGKDKAVPREGTAEHKEGATRVRDFTAPSLTNSGNNPRTLLEGQQSKVTPSRGVDSVWIPSFVARLASISQLEQRQSELAGEVSEVSRKSATEERQKSDKTSKSNLSIAQNSVVGGPNTRTDGQSREGARNGLANNVNIVPPSHPSHPSTLPRFGRPRPPNSPSLTPDYAEPCHAMGASSVEKEAGVDMPDEATFLKTHLDLPSRGPSRSSKDETASTTSTNTSRNRTICRSCGAAGSQITPLVPCSRCRRRYHDRCGNPKPQESKTLDEFVCGRCLRKEAGPTSRNSSQRSSVDRNIALPTVKAVPLGTVDDTSLSTHESAPASITAGCSGLQPQPVFQCQNSLLEENASIKDSAHGQKSNTAQEEQSKITNPFTSDSKALQGTLYKHITCPRWRIDGCPFHEAHCEFAHRDTGRYAPSITGPPAKDFTCPKWLSGTCSKSEADCPLAHTNTLLHVGPDKRACRKHITCYFWKTNDFCRHDEEECPYAHRDTGIVAWQPFREGHNRPGKYSLKAYICPRWQRREECRWMGHSCPYTHSPLGLSCPSITRPSNPQATESQKSTEQLVRVLQSEQSDTTGTSPNSEENSQDRASVPLSLPRWAMRARPSAITILEAAVLAQHIARTADHQQRRVSGHNRGGWVTDTKMLPEIPITEDTAQGDAKMTETGNPVRHMAKRSAILVDPRKRRMQESPRETPPVIPGKAEQSLAHRIPEDSTVSKISVAACSPTITDAGQTVTSKKSCAVCEKSIFGNASRWQRCSEGQPKDQACERGGIGVVNVSGETPSRLSSLGQDQDPLRVFESDQRMVGYHSDIPEAVLMQALVGNKLKRSAPEEVLFVAKKKAKVTNMSLQEVASSLPQEKQNGELGAHGSHGAQAPSQEMRDSLAELTRRVLVNSGNLSHTTDDVLHREHRSTAALALPPHREQELLSCKRIYGATATTASKGAALSADSLAIDDAIQAQASSPRIAATGPSRNNPTPYSTTHYQWNINDEIALTTTDAITASNPDRSREHHPHFAKSSETTAHISRKHTVTPITPVGRACACSRGHKRCFHNKEGSLDRDKCIRFVEEHNNQFPGRHKMSIREWQSIVDMARGPALQDLAPSAPDDRRRARSENAIHDLSSQTGATGSRAEDTVRRPALVDLQNTGQAGHAQTQGFSFVEDDPEDDIPLMQVMKSYQEHGRRYQEPSLSTADPEDEDEDGVHLARLKLSDTTKATKSPDTAPTSPSITHEKQNGMLSPVQSNRALEEHTFNGPSRATTEMQQQRWTKADEEKAIMKLRGRGVLFETDSESDQGLDDEATYRKSKEQNGPFQRPPELRNIYGGDSLRDWDYFDENHAQLSSSPHQQARPSKKQMIGNLLKYQCRERRRQFGNPHKEIDRRVPDVEVLAVIQRDLRMGDPLAVPELVTETVTMSFRDFIGMPEKPVIVQGKSKDELAYCEAKSDRDRNAIGISRVRRVKDDDKFPFVYARRV